MWIRTFILGFALQQEGDNQGVERDGFDKSESDEHKDAERSHKIRLARDAVQGFEVNDGQRKCDADSGHSDC